MSVKKFVAEVCEMFKKDKIWVGTIMVFVFLTFIAVAGGFIVTALALSGIMTDGWIIDGIFIVIGCSGAWGLPAVVSFRRAKNMLLFGKPLPNQ